MISVIVPMYNCEDYIVSLLDSLLIQTYRKFEIILIDDGSTDKTLEVVNAFQWSHKDDLNIKLLSIEHKGVSAARNKGIDAAEGDYIRFLDSDDLIPEGSMAALVCPMGEDGAVDLVIGKFRSAPYVKMYCGPSNLLGEKSMQDFVEDFVNYPRSFYYGVTWNKLYKKAIIDKNRIRFNEDIEWCEDFLFNLEYYHYCQNIWYLSDIVSIYTLRDDGLTKKPLSAKEKEKRSILDIKRKDKAVLMVRELKGNVEVFNRSWEYPTLLALVNQYTKMNSTDGFFARFALFKSLLTKKENKELIINSSKECEDKYLHFLFWGTKCHQYFLLFFLLNIKDLLFRQFPGIKKILLSNIKKRDFF